MTRVEVHDFGPIGHAAIELKPLTVFIGPNNSGKSYLALAIYALSRALLWETGMVRLDRVSRRWRHREDFTQDIVLRTAAELKKAWPNARGIPRGPISVREMPAGIQSVLAEALGSYGDSVSSEFGAELQRCYGTAIAELGRRGGNAQSAEFRISLSDESSGFSWEVGSSQDHLLKVKWDSSLFDQSIDFGVSLPPLRLLRESPEFFLQHVIYYMNAVVLRRLIGRSHYMPASRSGILLGHKTLASLIIGRSSLAWVEPMEIPRLPGVVTDLIQALLLLTATEPPKGNLKKVVAYLEGQMARGTVDMNAEVEYPEIYYENESGRYSLHQVSSMVSGIAPIVLFLKYVVRPGDVLIIEEPESHLDVDNQRKLARALVSIVRSGVKVLFTTHSDYFVNQINNLLLLSQLSPRRRAARGYSASEVLDPNDLGAYFFRPGDHGSSVEDLRITPDEGIPTNMFTDAHSALYNEAITLEHLVAAKAYGVPSR